MLALGLTGVLLAVSGSLIPANAATTGTTGSVTEQSISPQILSPADENAAMRFDAAMQPGFNIGNSLDVPSGETGWGNPLISQALLHKIKSLGFKSIRLPVTWGTHEGSAPSYTVDPVYLARVKQVVDWALSDGFYVVLNVHHDSWEWINTMPTNHDAVLAQFNATWTQIADEFKHESSRLVLESVNEPQFANTTTDQADALLNELNTSFFHIVRGSGGNNAHRYLLLPTLGDSTGEQAELDDLLAEIQSLHDPNLIASFHYYGYWPFGVNIAGYNTFNAIVQQDLVSTFTKVHDEFIANGIPVYSGEDGLFNDYHGDPNIIEHGEELKFWELLGYEARVNDITLSYWDDGGRIIDRNTLTLWDPSQFAMMKSSWTTRSGTASNDVLYVPKAQPVADESLTLNLNGTRFTGLYQGDRRLRQSRDYTVSGDQLTLTASLLTRLVGDQAYGVNATLEIRFSRGVPWQLNVTTNAQPVLQAATATVSPTDSFDIPTRFHGDDLSMMTAVYSDGSNAGSTSWTPYQEYDTEFLADYPNDNIVLTSTFLNSLTDGSRVTLTFYFWSGATVTYYVTKSGSTVTGTLS